MAAALPMSKARDEIDPSSDLGFLLFDPSPEATLAWIQHFLTVPNERGQIVTFIPKPQQRLMAFDETGRDLTVKARQTGSSSFKIARRIRRFTSGDVYGSTCLVAGDKELTTTGFRLRIQHHLRDLKNKGLEFKLKYDNDKEMVLEGLDNRFLFASGEQDTIGRSYASPEVFISEFAHWKHQTAMELLGDLLPGIPPPPYGNADIESTPDGDSGAFFEMCHDAKPLRTDALWTVKMYPWWTEPRYHVAAMDDPKAYADILVPQQTLNEWRVTFAPTETERNLMLKFPQDGIDAVSRILWRRAKKTEQDKTPAPFAQEFPEDLDSCWLGQEGRYFDVADGVDHLEYYRDRKRDPASYYERLTYKGSEIPFYGRNLAVWEMPTPVGIYVAWGDAAGGGTSKESDPTCIVVWNAQTNTVVARLNAKIGPKHSGAVMCAIGMFYNTAVVGFERSAHGETALQEMKELGYPEIYHHIDPVKGLGKNEVPKPGIYPTADMRWKMLEEFKQGITYQEIVSFDPLGVSQMNTFSWTKAEGRMKAQALKGQHDDWVMAAAGGWYVLKRARARLLQRRRRRDESQEIIIGRGGLVVGRGRGSQTGLSPHKAWFR